LKPEDYTLFVEEVSVDTLIEEEENRIKKQNACRFGWISRHFPYKK